MEGNNGTQSRNGTSTGGEDEDWLDPLAYCLIIAAIATFGVIGNCLNIVLYSSRNYHRESLSVYIRALAVSDSFVLLTTLADDTVSRLFDFHILYGTKAVCPVVLFFTSFFTFLSSTLLVAVAVDRYIVVAHPHKRPSMCTLKRGVITVVCIVILCTLIALPEVVWDQVETAANHVTGEEYSCPFLESMAYHLSLTIYSFMFILFLPFTVILILNLRVICLLRSSMKALAAGENKNMKSLALITIPVIGMTICSITLLLPIMVVEIVEFVFQWTATTQELQGKIEKAWDIANLIFLLNYSLNFYFFMVFSKHHRRKLKNAFSSCCKSRQHSESVSGLGEKSGTNTMVTSF